MLFCSLIPFLKSDHPHLLFSLRVSFRVRFDSPDFLLSGPINCNRYPGRTPFSLFSGCTVPIQLHPKGVFSQGLLGRPTSLWGCGQGLYSASEESQERDGNTRNGTGKRGRREES